MVSNAQSPGLSAAMLLVAPLRLGDCMSFGIYLFGYAILIAGLAYVAHLMHMPPRWIFAGAIVFTGIGILSAVKATRQRDPVN